MITRKLLLSALTLLAVTLFTGCKDNDADYLSLNIDSKEIGIGEEYQFFVTAQGLKGSEYSGSIRWTVETDDDTKAKQGSDYQVASINKFGKVTGLKEGSAMVKAIMDNGRFARAKLFVGRRNLTTDSIYVSRTEFYIAPNYTDTLTLSVSDKYADVQKFPVELIMSLATPDGEATGELPQTKAKLIPLEKVGTYKIELTSGSNDENAICTIKIGDYTKDVNITVDFTLYLSFNTIDPNNPGDNPGIEKPMDFKLQETQTLNVNFYVQDPYNRNINEEAVIAALSNNANYSVSGNISLITGVPQFTRISDGLWTMSIDVSVSDIAGNGSLVISAFGKSVKANIAVDDGKAYKAIYISFDEVNSYQLPPTGLVVTTSKIVEVSTAGAEPNTFVLRVWFYIDPDDRAKDIEWKMSQTGDAVIIPIGNENINTKCTDFKFKVGTSLGTAKVTFKVYNPQGEQGGKFAEFLNQEITASITVQDSKNIIVESVTFDPKTSETDAKAVPLKADVQPLTSAAVWPAVYTIQELLNGAKATVDPSSGEVSITHAGVIKVKATAGGAGKEQSDTHTITAKFKLETNTPKPVEISEAPSSMLIGDTYQIKKLLHANYTLNENEYQWKSSDPTIISVDGLGNIQALKDGDAKISVTVRDDYNMYAADQKTITVKSVNANVNFSDPKFSDYLVLYQAGDHATFYVDTEDGASEYYTFSLSRALEADGVYNVGSDFTGTIDFSSGESYTLNSGTITISGGIMTFNLSISRNTIFGTVTGSRPISDIEVQ